MKTKPTKNPLLIFAFLLEALLSVHSVVPVLSTGSSYPKILAKSIDEHQGHRRLRDETCPCSDEQVQQETVTTIRMIAPGGEKQPRMDRITNRFRDRAPAFKERTGVNVEVIGVGDRVDFNEEALIDATANIYDGYFFEQGMTGDMMELNGFADLTEFVSESQELAWTDIFPFNREHQALYDSKVLSIPCDGDIFSLFYRKDLFDQYNVSVPRTWDEYSEVAAFFDGMQVPNAYGNGTQELSGSCIERGNLGMAGFVFLVHASTVQTEGTASGIFFDQDTFEPLLGEAFAETLRHLENQVKYGAPDGKCCFVATPGSLSIQVDSSNRFS